MTTSDERAQFVAVDFLARSLRSYIHAMTPVERMDVIDLLLQGYCRNCGYAKPTRGPCSCLRDE